MKSKTQSRLLAVGGLITLIGTGTALGVVAQTSTSAPGVRSGAAGQEKHPEVIRALHALENAQKDMSKANWDFGGHKEKAMDLTKQAISELKLALKSDKK